MKLLIIMFALHAGADSGLGTAHSTTATNFADCAKEAAAMQKSEWNKDWKGAGVNAYYFCVEVPKS